MDGHEDDFDAMLFEGDYKHVSLSSLPCGDLCKQALSGVREHGFKHDLVVQDDGHIRMCICGCCHGNC